jgi:hypothetical protein
MNALAQFKKEHSLTDQQLAEMLSEKLNRNISSKGVAQQLRRESPSIPWLNALGISPKEPGNLKNSPPQVNSPGISSNIVPEVALPFELKSATATIEMIYTIAGKGAAMASKTPAVADAWQNSAPGLAQGWIEWAKENRTVANGIAMLTVGGPGGQVILTNASLLVTTLMLIQHQKGIQLIPPQFVPPHENPNMDDEKIRENTEEYVDHALRNSPPQSG